MIKTFDGGIIVINSINYVRFNEGRERFFNNLKELGGIAKTPYLGATENIDIHIFGIDVTIAPHSFNASMYKSVKSMTLRTEVDGDKILDIVGYVNNKVGFIYKIKTYDGGVVEKTSMGYTAFLKGRETFCNILKKYNLTASSPFLGNKSYVDIQTDTGFTFNILANSLKTTVKTIDKMNALIKDNSDINLGIVGYDNGVNGNGLIFKIRTFDGAIINKSSFNYIAFIEGRKKVYAAIKEMNGDVLSPYLGDHKNIKCKIGNAIIDISATRVKCKLLPRYKAYLKLLDKNNDKLVSIDEYNSTGFIFTVNTFDGATVTMSCQSFHKFVRGRNLFYNALSEVSATTLSPYKANLEPVEIIVEGLKVKTAPHKVKHYIVNDILKFKKYIIENNDEFIKIVSYGSNGFVFEIKTFDGGILNMSYGAYLTFNRGRKKFFKCLNKRNHTALSPYLGCHELILIDYKCPKHEATTISPYYYIVSSGECPKCSESKGEVIIQKYLTEKSIAWDDKFSIITNDTEQSRKKYDLHLTDYHLIVEVHGRQHYMEVEYFSSRTLEEEQENDKKKKKYALDNGYHYIAVDYREHKPALALKRFKKQFEEFKKLHKNFKDGDTPIVIM